MTSAEVTQFINGLLESTFKNQIQKELSAQDNKDLYAEEAAAERESASERQRMLSILGLTAPSKLQDEMLDSIDRYRHFDSCHKRLNSIKYQML